MSKSPVTASRTPAGEAHQRLPRLGFLGVGRIGQRRLEAIAQSGTGQIVAVADPVADNITQAAEIAPDALALTSPDKLFEVDLDGVVIATPSALHADQSVAWLNRGVAVFCQKPLGRSADETRRVVEAARAANRLLGVDMSYRFTTGMQKIHELVQRGELGSVYAVNLVFHNAYGPDKAWFYNPRLSGGGCVIDLGVHLVDLALWVLNFPAVTGVSSRLFAEGEPLENPDMWVEDYAIAQFDLDTGAAIQLACSWKLHAGRDAVIEAEFYGTAGGAALRNLDGSFHDFVAERFYGTRTETLSALDEAERGWSGRAIINWVERLAAGSSFDPANEELVQVATVLDRIYAR